MNKRIIVSFLVLVTLLTGALLVNFGTNNANAATNSYEETCKRYTSSDTPNGISIKSYATEANERFSSFICISTNQDRVRTASQGEYFQNGCLYHGEYNIVVGITVSADDNITKIIPKEAFTEKGKKYYMGSEYGFYVNTKEENNQLKSTVVLFDITAENSTSTDHLFSLTVNILMEADYFYVKNNAGKFEIEKDMDGQYESYCSQIQFQNGLTDAVIPAIRSDFAPNFVGINAGAYYFAYRAPKIDISDISFGATIYNANSLNYGDADYNIDNDYGYFFIGNEYEFSGSKKKSTGDPVAGLKKFTDTATSVFLGKILDDLGPVGKILKAIDNGIAVAEAVQVAIGGEMTYDATNKNYEYPNLHLHNTRDSQKEAYGGLIKASAITINTTGDDKIYFYNNGSDYAKGTYTFSHTDKSTGKEYGQLNTCIAMKITEDDEEKAYVSSNITFDISSQETHTLNVMQEHNYYMLPNGTMKFVVNPEFGGDYVFDVPSDAVELFLNGSIQNSINGKYTLALQGNRIYYITLHNRGDQIAKGKVSSDCTELIGTHTIGAEQNKIYKLSSSGPNFRLLSTQNENVKFAKSYFSDMAVNDVAINNSEYVLASKYGKYYIVLNNDSDKSQDFTVVERQGQTFSGGSYTNIAANQKYAKFRLQANGQGEYVVKFTFYGTENIPSIKLYRTDLTNKAYSVSQNGRELQYKMSMTNTEAVVFIFERGAERSSKLDMTYVVYQRASTKWIVNGKETTNGELQIRRGDSFSLSYVNRVGVETEVSASNISWRDQNILTLDGDRITVSNKAQLQRTSIEFVENWVEYDTEGNAEVATDTHIFYVDIIIDNAVNSALTWYNDASGVGVNINKDYIRSVQLEFTVGSNKYQLTSKVDQTKYNILSDIGSITVPDNVTVKVLKVWYICSLDSSENTSIELKNGTKGLNIASTTLNLMFGNNSTTSSYNIYNRRHLESIRRVSTSGKTYKLCNNIDLYGTDWTPIATFYGTFNGDMHTITNMTIKIPQNQPLTNYGLFGENRGTIKRLLVYNINISSVEKYEKTNVYVGGIVGTNRGTIDDCRVSGRIVCKRAYSAIGGIAGASIDGTIENSLVSNLYMYGNGDIGGIVGVVYNGEINDCSTHSMTLELYSKYVNRSVGGIAGYLANGSIVQYCYNEAGKINFIDYDEIAWDEIAPRMGIIVGGMNDSTVRNVSVEGVTLSKGKLPEKTNNGNIFHVWYYPCRYIGKYGDGAVGNSEGASTITGTGWQP